MSIIQNLRDRAAWIISGAIAFALLIFVVEEGLRNKSVFGGSDTDLGKVNGTVINRIDFEERFKKIEDRYAQMGYPMDDAMRVQQKNSFWNETVEEAIMDKVYENLGIEVTDKELGDILYGPGAPEDFKQRFTDPKTQVFDANLAYQTVQKLRSQKNTPDYRSFFGEYIPAQIKNRKREKYIALFSESAYTPKWLVEKQNTENSQAASFTFINIPYSTISDSAVKVTDSDIEEYVKKHKSLFKQEKAAAMDYVLFSGAPSSEDTARVINGLLAIKDTFSRTTDMSTFLQYENTQTQYYNSYISKKEIKIQALDSIIAAGGSAYGPYRDVSSYVLARNMGSRNLPDTVKARHILIATQQQNANGQMMLIRTEEDAKKLADSIATAISGGANFDSLCARFSDDGTKNTGGVYDGVVTGRMVAPFNDFIFTNSPGSKGVVRTDFGYHYVEVLSHKGSSPAYKIAYVSRPILTSDETVNGAMGLATQFAGESRNRKSFEENAKKNKLTILNAAEVKPLDVSVGGISGNARELVRWLFNEASEGEIAERPFAIGTSFVVPLKIRSYEEGTMNADRARPLCEYKIRQEKKAELIVAKAGQNNTLEALATAYSTPVNRADSAMFSNPQVPNVGYEPKVLGAAFNKNNQAKVSKPIAGELGVFFLKTEKVIALPNPNMDIAGQQSMQEQSLKMMIQRSLFENKRKAASVTDNRYKYF